MKKLLSEMNMLQKLFWLIAVVVIAGFLILNMSGSDSSSNAPPAAPSTGAAATGAINVINGTSDCVTLQTVFDNWDRNPQDHPANDKLAVMRAADARMSAVGCY